MTPEEHVQWRLDRFRSRTSDDLACGHKEAAAFGGLAVQVWEAAEVLLKAIRENQKAPTS
jgi:hypothetical protein